MISSAMFTAMQRNSKACCVKWIMVKLRVYGNTQPVKQFLLVTILTGGPAIRETLQIVKGMTHAGNAIALMGNHEYNALAYAYQRPDGTYLRSHSEKHTH